MNTSVQTKDSIVFADKTTSRIGLGTMPLGGDLCGPTKESLARDILEQSLECGIRLWDTAPFYGSGKVESMCGEVLSSSGLQNEVILITKGGLSRDPVTHRPVREATREALLRGIEGSLNRLKTDKIDIYQLHWPDSKTPVEETATTLRELKEEGVIRHIGICNASQEALQEFQEWAPLHSHEMPFSLLDTSLRTTMLQASRSMNLPVLAYSVLAQGLLARDPHQPIDTTPKFRFFSPWFQSDQLPKYQKACQDLEKWASTHYGATLAQLAVRYVLDEPGVTIALWGVHHPKQLPDLKTTLGWSLSTEERASIEELLQKAGIPASQPRQEPPGPPVRNS